MLNETNKLALEQRLQHCVMVNDKVIYNTKDYEVGGGVMGVVSAMISTARNELITAYNTMFKFYLNKNRTQKDYKALSKAWVMKKENEAFFKHSFFANALKASNATITIEEYLTQLRKDTGYDIYLELVGC